MTRNEWIAECVAACFASTRGAGPTGTMIHFIIDTADALESAGCAPWVVNDQRGGGTAPQSEPSEAEPGQRSGRATDAAAPSSSPDAESEAIDATAADLLLAAVKNECAAKERAMKERDEARAAAETALDKRDEWKAGFDRLRDQLNATMQAVAVARCGTAESAALTAIRELVSPENDPPDEAYTPEGIVKNVRTLVAALDEAEAALKVERNTADTFRDAIRRLLEAFDGDEDAFAHTPPHIRHAIMFHDSRRAAESREIPS